MIALPDEHPAWRVVGAWIAARQRGDERLVLSHVVEDARREEVVRDLAALAQLGGGPLRTGAELEVDARARALDATTITGLQLTLRGRTEAGPVVAVLSIDRLEAADGTWRIASLLSADERRIIADPAFLRLLKEGPPQGT